MKWIEDQFNPLSDPLEEKLGGEAVILLGSPKSALGFRLTLLCKFRPSDGIVVLDEPLGPEWVSLAS